MIEASKEELFELGIAVDTALLVGYSMWFFSKEFINDCVDIALVDLYNRTQRYCIDSVGEVDTFGTTRFQFHFFEPDDEVMIKMKWF